MSSTSATSPCASASSTSSWSRARPCSSRSSPRSTPRGRRVGSPPWKPSGMSDGPIIEAADLHKSFALNHERIDVLRGVDMRVARGEIVAIVGASGAGKSTLLHLLGGLDRPTSGRIMVDGVQADRLRERELEAFRNRTVGFVFQFHHLLPEFTALEKVRTPGLIRDELRKQVVELKDE